MMSQPVESPEVDPSAMLCAFALHGGRYCTRRAGHAATDGRVTRHDSTANEHYVGHGAQADS
jgi:hypothetical protein